MRYVAGDDLRSLVRREGRLEPRRAARLIVARSARRSTPRTPPGLVHRDVKPANVLLGPDEHVYLTDFGLTKHALSIGGATKPGHWVGTLDYVAPEQIRGERVDARADVYALGCVLYYALTGHVAFPARGRRGAAVGAPVRARRRAVAARAAGAGGARRGRRARAGQAARRPLPVGRRPRRAPRSRRPGTATSPARGASGAAARAGATAATWPDGPRPGRRRPGLAAAVATAAVADAVAAVLFTPSPVHAARSAGAPPSTTTIAAAPAKPPGGRRTSSPPRTSSATIHVGARPVNVEVGGRQRLGGQHRARRRSIASRSVVTVAAVAGRTSASASPTSPTGAASSG